MADTDISKMMPYALAPSVRRAGFSKSAERLRDLGFDPIERLVLLYNRLCAEDTFWCELRDSGSVTVYLDDLGEPIESKTIRYSSMSHIGVLSQIEKVSANLLSYGYAKVPNTILVEEKKRMPMVINLHKDNSTFLLSSHEDDIEEVYEDD
jgi:hypothetical protein